MMQEVKDHRNRQKNEGVKERNHGRVEGRSESLCVVIKSPEYSRSLGRRLITRLRHSCGFDFQVGSTPMTSVHEATI